MKYLSIIPLALVVAVGCSPTADSTSNTPSTNGLKDSYDASAGLESPKFEAPKDGEEVGVISTKYGKIVLKFRPDLAPKHVENFKKLAKQGFYDKTLFHRIIPNFMIQGGDPNTKGTDTSKYGQGGPGYNVNAEFNNLDHKRGVLSMARSGDPNSAGSQFFICVADSGQSLNRQYTAFGEVVSGLDVADKIVQQPRNANDLPNDRIEMTVKIEKWPVK